MQARHKIPNIFNLSMVDVLCCALGCVILLWLLNLREVNRKTLLAGSTATKLSQVETDRERARTLIASLEKRIASLEAERDSTQDQLAKKTTELRELDRKVTAATQRVAALQLLVREKDQAAVATANRVEDLENQLTKEEARVKALMLTDSELKKIRDLLAVEEELAKKLAKQLASRTEDLTDARKSLVSLRDEKLALETELSDKNKILTVTREGLESLRADKANLVAEVGRARAAVDNRFAGIELTGRRVMFIVDMSGSMELVDENTAAPLKWMGVRETVAKLMKSLPDLQKYQIIVFSERTSFLLGRDGQWLDFEGLKTIDEVTRQLAAIRPTGGTNMSSAFETAFRYRSSGLDTIYLLSDGLPNIGEGLPANSQNLNDVQRGEILGKYIRNMLKTNWNKSVPDSPRVRINAIGFFYESPDVGAFLWALARENDGSFVGMSKP